ncbi:MAG: Stp1/IreP family PP2C-type Ser/Thr phosphatase [Erysipelotrichaceae bacterium]
MISFGLSDIGNVRKINQDSYFVSEKANEILAIVCDGIGGGNAGDVASDLVCDIIKESFKKQKEFSTIKELREWLNLIITKANEAIIKCSEQIKEYQGMGTTLVGYYSGPIGKVVINIGDSRVYALADNNLEQITYDHTLVYDMYKRGILSEAQFKVHPHKNVISNALGANINFKIDFHELKLEKVKMLLCSDGLSDMISDEEIKKILISNTSIAEQAEQLVKLAKNAGGHDNVTVVIVEDKKND